ncbi:hypothetical protein ES703_03501 [subsurface metagenome]
MAITFLQAKKRQKNLILVLALAILAIVLLVWFSFLRREAPPSPLSPALAPLEIKIDWETLQNPQLESLQIFEEVLPFEDEGGRENPFISY